MAGGIRLSASVVACAVSITCANAPVATPGPAASRTTTKNLESACLFAYQFAVDMNAHRHPDIRLALTEDVCAPFVERAIELMQSRGVEVKAWVGKRGSRKCLASVAGYCPQNGRLPLVVSGLSLEPCSSMIRGPAEALRDESMDRRCSNPPSDCWAGAIWNLEGGMYNLFHLRCDGQWEFHWSPGGYVW